MNVLYRMREPQKRMEYLANTANALGNDDKILRGGGRNPSRVGECEVPIEINGLSSVPETGCLLSPIFAHKVLDLKGPITYRLRFYRPRSKWNGEFSPVTES